MAPAGTPVYSWDNLQVVRISGGSGSRGSDIGGWNVYLQDHTGHQYFMTHVENLRVKVGMVLRPGQPIAQVGRYAGMATHTHIGYTGGDPVDVLGLQPNFIFTPGGAIAGSTVIQQREARLPKAKSGGAPLANVPVLGSAGRAAIGGLDWVLSPVDSAIGAAKSPLDALNWIGGNWDRVAEVAAGFILVLVGLIQMSRAMGLGVPGAKLATKMTPAGRIAGAVT